MSSPLPFAGCFSASGESNLVFFGIADDTQSTFLRGAADGPRAIRSGYDGAAFNATTELGVDLAERVQDLGDLEPNSSWELSARAYRERAASLFQESRVPFIAGGDHAVTIPVAEALEARGRPVHVIQVDAHPDLYPDFEGNRFSHACTAARILEMDHVASLTQIGVRTLNEVQRGVAKRHPDRLIIHEARDFPAGLPSLANIPDGDEVYLTIDIDGVDPAFAPGVSHAVPGGLTSRQVLSLIQGGHWTLVGMDVVEVNPTRDRNAQTAILAGRLLHEGMGYASER